MKLRSLKFFKNNIEVFFFSFLYKKFVNKVFLNGQKFRVEKFLYLSIYLVSVLRLFYKSFFFHFYEMFEKLKLSYNLKSQKRGNKVFKIPVPVFHIFRYKYALKTSRWVMKNYLNNFKYKNKIQKFFNLLYFNFMVYKKNFLTTSIRNFKKEILNNRIFLHWRWKKKKI